MAYTEEDVFSYVEQEDVRFIRLCFSDIRGHRKNISILPGELRRAFRDGISFDASAVYGFGDESRSDLLLFPDPATLCPMPWRPSHGRVVRMLCDIRHPDGTPALCDGRRILRDTVARAAAAGLTVRVGAEYEFYLFRTDENGDPTTEPMDRAGYMDTAPLDRGENLRREICMALFDMGIIPESSHHEEGPGQNEIDFRYRDPLGAADDAMTFRTAVAAIAGQNGFYADFSPKPLSGESGNGFHINLSVLAEDGRDVSAAFLAGILTHIRSLTAALDPTEASYRRLGEHKAPRYVAYSDENRSALVRLPAAKGEYRRMEVRSPDPTANPYIAYALLIAAGLDGVEKNLVPPPPVRENLFTAAESTLQDLAELPASLAEARELFVASPLVRSVLGAAADLI